MSPLHPTEKVRQVPQYNQLIEYVRSGRTDLDRITEDFCSPIETQLKASPIVTDVESSLWQAWQCLIVVAATTPHDSENQQRLVSLVQDLQRRPGVEKDGKPCEIQGGVIWNDLPLFGWQMRESWNAAASDDSDEESKQQWVNLNAWTAKLVAAVHNSASDKPDMSLYCIWTIRMALEEVDKPADVALSAAAVWFVYAAPSLWNLCRQKKTFDGKVAKPGARHSDQLWRGFARDRWRAWGERFREVHGQASDKGTVHLVERARRAMGEVVER